jgi:hypothetical protein
MVDLAREVALLQSEDAAGLLAAALTGGVPEALRTVEAELTTWQYRPGAEVTAGDHLTYTTADGTRAEDDLFATSAVVGPPAVTVSRDDLRVDVWRHPHDPRLPALASACDPGTVIDWLTADGSEVPAELELTLLAYRPTRRAVLQATADGDSHYIKVLRPERADRLVRRQHLLAQAGLTPAAKASPAPGVLVTPAAEGVPLTTLLADPQRSLPSARDLVTLLDRLPADVCDLEHRPSWSDRLDFHAATARDRLPEEGRRIEDLTTRLGAVIASAPTSRVRATHGDFYESNIMVDDHGRLSLIDLDAVGPGRRDDDLACLLAHVAVLPHLSPQHFGDLPPVLSAWTEEFEREVHPASLAGRTAAVVLSLVSGAEADQARHRLDLAETWTARAVAAAG